MTIRENSTVKVIGGFYEGKTGKVVKIHDYAEIAVVSFDDNGDLGKVSLSELIEVQPQADRIVDVKIEIPEGAKKISRADFDAALDELISPEKMLADKVNPTVSFAKVLTVKIIGDTIRDEIFKDQDVVVMTEDTFVSAMWDACNPTHIREAMKSKDSAGKIIKLAITALISMEEIVGILFGAENG